MNKVTKKFLLTFSKEELINVIERCENEIERLNENKEINTTPMVVKIDKENIKINESEIWYCGFDNTTLMFPNVDKTVKLITDENEIIQISEDEWAIIAKK
jgi:competence protein ComGF